MSWIHNDRIALFMSLNMNDPFATKIGHFDSKAG